MNMGNKITDRPELKEITEDSAYLVEDGNGSGTKYVKHETLVKEIEKALPIGDTEELKELNTEGEKLTLVKAILKVLGKATTAFKGTDGVKAGIAGLVPAPTAEDKGKVLGAEGKWVTVGSGGGGDVAAENVKFSDGKTAEEKLGMIDGATDDLNCENDRMVAKMVAVKQLNDSLKFPDGNHFYPDMQDGKPGFNTDPERGADTFVPFRSESSNGSFYINGKYSTSASDIPMDIHPIAGDDSDYSVEGNIVTFKTAGFVNITGVFFASQDVRHSLVIDVNGSIKTYTNTEQDTSGNRLAKLISEKIPISKGSQMKIYRTGDRANIFVNIICEVTN